MQRSYKRILVVAATEKELQDLDVSSLSKLHVETLVTGVGMVATTFALTEKLGIWDFDLVLNIGIAGTFMDDLGIGDVIYVDTDVLVELGAEDGDRFIPADELGLIHQEDLLFSTEVDMKGILFGVTGITVNRVHGNKSSIKRVKKQFSPDVESMEGAAVGYVCMKLGVPWLQVRAISNRVEPRNTDKWAIELALTNLHFELKRILQKWDDEA